jgi:hypothetical protein
MRYMSVTERTVAPGARATGDPSIDETGAADATSSSIPMEGFRHRRSHTRGC